MGCTVLLLRKGTRSKWHRSPGSIATITGNLTLTAGNAGDLTATGAVSVGVSLTEQAGNITMGGNLLTVTGLINTTAGTHVVGVTFNRDAWEMEGTAVSQMPLTRTNAKRNGRSSLIAIAFAG